MINDVRILLTDGSYIHLSKCLHIEYIPDACSPSTVEFVCSYCVIKLSHDRIECIRPDWEKNSVRNLKMRKNQIDNLISSCNEMEQKIVEVKRNLEYSRSVKLSDYSNPVDREQARESLEHNENEMLCALLEVNKMTEDMVKKIDIEAWRER